jgi:hypothetical protein
LLYFIINSILKGSNSIIPRGIALSSRPFCLSPESVSS